MLPADSPALRLLALQQLIAAVHTGRWQALLDAGIKPETLDRLRQTTFEDAELVAARDDLCIRLTIDGPSLERSLDRIERQRADEKIKEYFVRQGATPRLIQHLFKLDRSTLERLRRLFGASCRGRTPMPKPRERDEIHSKWRALSASHEDARMRYYLLHQAYPQHAIRVLEAVLKEFEE